MKKWQRFESSVNSEGIETNQLFPLFHLQFESSVNSEGIETTCGYMWCKSAFESSVNSEGIETAGIHTLLCLCLRAV